MEMGMTGAGGNTKVRWRREGRIAGREYRSDDHPAGVSPKPWRNIKAAAFSLLHADDVDMAADTDAVRRLKNMQEPSMHKPSSSRKRR
jgi:hypothetical protein